MKYTIKSLVLDRSVTFSRPGRLYVYWDINDCSPGVICKLSNGNILTYSGYDPAEFEQVCSDWYEQLISDYEHSMPPHWARSLAELVA